MKDSSPFWEDKRYDKPECVMCGRTDGQFHPCPEHLKAALDREEEARRRGRNDLPSLPRFHVGPVSLRVEILGGQPERYFYKTEVAFFCCECLRKDGQERFIDRAFEDDPLAALSSVH